MKRMKVLVTGGAGFIGSHLCERLLDDGHEVICLDNFDPYYDLEIKKDNIKECLKNHDYLFLDVNIMDKEKLLEVFTDNGIEKVVHLAARAGVRASIENPLIYTSINVDGTINLLEMARKFDVGKFIFGSSSSVYGTCDKIPFRENYDLKPISPYGASKISAEHFCHVYNHLYGIPVTCLRFFTVYGPRQRPDMAIHKFTRLIDQGEEIPVYGDGSSKRDYTYIDDIIDGVVSALEKKFGFEIFNLGNSEVVELRYLILLIENELNKKAKIKRLPDQSGDVPITYADISKAKKLLGYAPDVFIDEGIKRFVEWYKVKY